MMDDFVSLKLSDQKKVCVMLNVLEFASTNTDIEENEKGKQKDSFNINNDLFKNIEQKIQSNPKKIFLFVLCFCFFAISMELGMSPILETNSRVKNLELVVNGIVSYETRVIWQEKADLNSFDLQLGKTSFVKDLELASKIKRM